MCFIFIKSPVVKIGLTIAIKVRHDGVLHNGANMNRNI